MTKPTRAQINCQTGEMEIVELTDEEIAANEQAALEYAQIEAQREAEAQAKAEIKASALAKLAALGLTEDEAKAIAG